MTHRKPGRARKAGPHRIHEPSMQLCRSFPPGYDLTVMGDIVLAIPACADCAKAQVWCHARSDGQLDVYLRHDPTCPAQRSRAPADPEEGT